MIGDGAACTQSVNKNHELIFCCATFEFASIHSPIMWLSISFDLFAGCGIIVISSLIRSGFNSELLELDELAVDVELLFLLSFLATVLWAE